MCVKRIAYSVEDGWCYIKVTGAYCDDKIYEIYCMLNATFLYISDHYKGDSDTVKKQLFLRMFCILCIKNILDCSHELYCRQNMFL